MSSVQDFGGRCPICGHPSVISDFDCRTMEDYRSCACCGFTSNYAMERDDKYDVNFVKERTFNLDEEEVFMGAGKKKNWQDDEIVFSIKTPVTENMSVADIKSFMNTNDGLIRNVFVHEDGKDIRLLYFDSKIEIIGNQFTVLMAKWNEEEYGGYGVIKFTPKDGGITAIHILREELSMENAKKSLEDVENINDLNVVIALYHPETKKFEFDGITEEEWFEDCDFDGELNEEDDSI